jgi:2-methylcitrate dehydratase PrpD
VTCGRAKKDEMLATAYEISGDLTKGIALDTHRIDHALHIAAGMVTGIGAMLRLPVEVIHILPVCEAGISRSVPSAMAERAG